MLRPTDAPPSTAGSEDDEEEGCEEEEMVVFVGGSSKMKDPSVRGSSLMGSGGERGVRGERGDGVRVFVVLAP